MDGVPINNDTQRTGDNTYRGVDFGSGLNDINPEDIESISVLKGGSPYSLLNCAQSCGVTPNWAKKLLEK